jgi:hypothetical protein
MKVKKCIKRLTSEIGSALDNYGQLYINAHYPYLNSKQEK